MSLRRWSAISIVAAVLASSAWSATVSAASPPSPPSPNCAPDTLAWMDACAAREKIDVKPWICMQGYVLLTALHGEGALVARLGPPPAGSSNIGRGQLYPVGYSELSSQQAALLAQLADCLDHRPLVHKIENRPTSGPVLRLRDVTNWATFKAFAGPRLKQMLSWSKLHLSETWWGWTLAFSSLGGLVWELRRRGAQLGRGRKWWLKSAAFLVGGMALLAVQRRVPAHRWPWGWIALVAGAALLAWMIGRARRSPPFGVTRNGPVDGKALLIEVAAPLAFGLAALLGCRPLWRAGGPFVDADSLRDLLHALDIAQNGTSYGAGPAIAGLPFLLSPVYYHFLAIPLRISQTATAVAAWHACGPALTVSALYVMVRRAYAHWMAALVCVLFLRSPIEHEVFDILTHSNWSFVVAVLAVYSLHQLVARGRELHLVWLFFWCSLAMQFHFSGAVLVLLVVVVALITRRDVSSSVLLAACVAGALPLLPTLPSQIISITDDAWLKPLAWLQRQTGLVPMALLALTVGRPSVFATRHGRCVIGATFALWLVGYALLRPYTVDGPLALRFFQMVIPLRFLREGGLPSQPGSLLGQVADYLRAAPTNALLTMLGAALVGLGIWRGVRVGWAWFRSRRAGAGTGDLPSLPADVIMVSWLVCTLPPSVAACLELGVFPRYFAQALVPLIVVAVLGVGEVGRWLRALGGFKATGIHATGIHTCRGLSIVVVLLALFVAARGGSSPAEEFGRHRLLSVARMFEQARQRVGLDGQGMASHLHGALDGRVAPVDGRNGAGVFLVELQAIADERQRGGSPAQQRPDQHYYLVEPSDLAARRPGAERLDAVGLVAVPSPHALVYDQVHLQLPDGHDVPLTLPWRFDATSSFSPSLRPSLGLQPQPLSSGVNPESALAHGGPVRVVLPRDPPVDATANEIEVVVGRIESQFGAPCQVKLEAAGQSRSARFLDGSELTRWRFSMPPQSQRVSLILSVADCSVGLLDVYDVFPSE